MEIVFPMAADNSYFFLSQLRALWVLDKNVGFFLLLRCLLTDLLVVVYRPIVCTLCAVVVITEVH